MLHAAPPPGNDKYPFEPDSPSSTTYITRAAILVKEERGGPVCDGERLCVGSTCGGSCRLYHPSVGAYGNTTRERQYPSGSCSVCVFNTCFLPLLLPVPSSPSRRLRAFVGGSRLICALLVRQ